MEATEYEIMFHREEDYWWYVGLRDLVRAQTQKFLRDRKSFRILDAGCGTGKLLEESKAFRPVGLEYSTEALKFVRRRGMDNVVQASVCQIPFADESFDLVTSMDVLYTVQAPGDLQSLREFRRILKPGGMLLMNLPAYNFLRSHHDVAIHTRQRYTQGGLRSMLTDAGFRIFTITYRNTALFPLAAGLRLVQKLFNPRPESAQSDLRPLPRLVNWAFMLPLFLENRLIRLGGRLPFGLSVYCVAIRP